MNCTNCIENMIFHRNLYPLPLFRHFESQEYQEIQRKRKRLYSRNYGVFDTRVLPVWGITLVFPLLRRQIRLAEGISLVFFCCL